MNPNQPVGAAVNRDISSSRRIRAMRLEDLPVVQLIDRLSFTLPWPESSFRYELLENPRSLLRVAEVQQANGNWLVVGEIVVWLVLDEAHIATIAVHPDYRSSGIARVLLVDVLIESIKKGIRQATLEVRDSNLVARKLYHRFGFREVGVRPHYYKDNNEDALIMTVSGLDDQTLKWLESGEWQSTNTHPVQ